METCGVHEEHDFCNESNTQSENVNASCEVDESIIEPVQNICPPGMHSWHDDMCMICTVCRECTGYSINCLSSMGSERNPGQYVFLLLEKSIFLNRVAVLYLKMRVTSRTRINVSNLF